MKTQSIIDHLLSGKEISSLDAVNKFKTVKLTSRISDLRQAGYKISDRWEENKKTKSRYKVYFLTK